MAPEVHMNGTKMKGPQRPLHISTLYFPICFTRLGRLTLAQRDVLIALTKTVQRIPWRMVLLDEHMPDT